MNCPKCSSVLVSVLAAIADGPAGLTFHVRIACSMCSWAPAVVTGATPQVVPRLSTILGVRNPQDDALDPHTFPLRRSSHTDVIRPEEAA